MYRIKSLLVILFFTLYSLAFPFQVLAANYGECGYGEGNYGEGCTPASPTPSSIPTPSNRSSGSSHSSSSHSALHCSDRSPVGEPDLFQIDRTGSQATLYFVPVNDHVESYHVTFGFYDGDERFGGINMKAQNGNQGVQSIVVNHLNEKTSYSFKVVSVNGCAPGEWSNWLTAGSLQAQTSIFYRYWEKVKNIFR